MHRSKLPLRTWFEAVHLMTSHSNGISAEQAQAQLGIRSYKTAWLLLHKLRRAMVDPNRSLLQGVVEVDESEVPHRSKHDPIANHGIPKRRHPPDHRCRRTRRGWASLPDAA